MEVPDESDKLWGRLLSKIWSYVDAKQGLIADGLMQTRLQHAAYPNLA